MELKGITWNLKKQYKPTSKTKQNRLTVTENKWTLGGEECEIGEGD